MSLNPKIIDPREMERMLREHFAGKRDALRTPTLLDVIVEGHHGSFDALVVDVSRSGMLLRLLDDEFDGQGLVPYTARARFHFGSGLSVEFRESGIHAESSVVRVTEHVTGTTTVILVGCRFRYVLTANECERLGAECTDDRSPAEE